MVSSRGKLNVVHVIVKDGELHVQYSLVVVCEGLYPEDLPLSCCYSISFANPLNLKMIFQKIRFGMPSRT